MSISSKIESLITAANSVTGESRADLTACVQDLKDGYGGGLPSEYQAVEYIEQSSEGVPKINTDYIIKATDNIYIKFFIPTAGFSQWGGIFGTVDWSQSYPINCQKACRLSLTDSSSNFSYARGGDDYYAGYSLLNDVIEFRVFNSLVPCIVSKPSNKTSASVLMKSSQTYANIKDCTTACPIFENNMRARLYAFTITGENYEQAVNLIPCYRKSDNEAGVFDTARRIFLTNAGTGSFTCYPAPPST